MGTGTKQAKTATASGPQKMAPLAMSTSDHTTFVDLLFQKAAQAARTATAVTEPKALLAAAGQAVVRARAALAAYTMPGTGAAPKQLFRTVDGAFMHLYDLFFVVRGQPDEAVAKYAPEIQAVMVEINERFEPLGWKVPKSDVEGHTRAKAANANGAATVTSAEKGQLGRMHVRAARQHIVGGWAEVSSGDLGGAASAAQHLADAMTILIDPQLADELPSLAAEVAATENVLGRLVMAIEQADATKLGRLRELAQRLDALVRLVGREPSWVAKVSKTDPAKAPPAAQTAPAQAAPGTLVNEVDRGAPRAEPAMHRAVEPFTYTKKVHIRDTYLVDEYLGYIELFIEGYRTASGQVYTQNATATKRLEGRAGEYLSMGADISSHSVDLNGHRYCDVFFDIKIGGPNKTSTTGVSVGAKGTASSSDKTSGAEVSASVTFATSVSSQGTRSFRRVYRIAALDKAVEKLRFNPLDLFEPPRLELSQIVEHERMDLHRDFSEFELDDDDVGDDLFTFYSNWILHSSDT